ncbi:mitochondrial putative NADH:ubiquinone oxidoreductase 6.5 kDa subunit [Haematococcus lacustris]
MPEVAPRVGFQWRRYEAWRHHPLLKPDKANMFPGLRIAFGVFLACKLYEATQPAEEHH